MLDLKIAKRLIARLGSMSMAPAETGAVLLRSEALAKYARSEGHAERVVQTILERDSYFPTVAVIVQECETSPDDAQLQSFRRDCPHCHGDGWRIVDGPYGTSAAYPCNHTAAGDPRMGVPMPRAAESMYQREAQAIPARREKYKKA